MRRALVLALAFALVPAHVHADAKADAQEHVQRARQAHAAGKYDDALKELTLAYALDPKPKLLYAIGQIHMKLGDCERASEFYRRFLASHPAPKEAAVVRQAITQCETAKPVKSAEPPPEPPVEPPPPPPPPIKPIRPIEPPPPAAVQKIIAPRPVRDTPGWYTDGLGDTFVVVGLAAGVVAGVSYRAAVTNRDAADTIVGYQNYSDLIDRAQRERDIALGCTIGGGVALTIGLIRYLAHDRRPTERAIGLHVGHGQTFITYEARL